MWSCRACIALGLFAAVRAAPSLYTACPYSDGSSYGSTYNLGVGPAASLVWNGAANPAVQPQQSFCECASGYADPSANGTCYPISATQPSTVDPLNFSPPPQLVYSSSSPSLVSNIFSFQVTGNFTQGRNTTWYMSALSPNYVPSSMTTGGSWQLSSSNDLRCRRPGLFDVSAVGRTFPSASENHFAAMDWVAINSGRNGPDTTSVCGWSVTTTATQYINQALLTIVAQDPIPNSGLVRTQAQTYPLKVTVPRNVNVASTAIQVNSTINVQAALIDSLFTPSNGRLILVLQTSVVAPWQLAVNYGTAFTLPSGYTITSGNWTYNDISMCTSNANTTCVQQFVYNATVNIATVCPAAPPQQGTLNAQYGLSLGISPRAGSASAPDAIIRTNITSDNICNTVTVGVATQVGMAAYQDAAFTQAAPSTGFTQGQQVNWQLTASSSQVSVLALQLNQVWFAQGSAFSSSGGVTSGVTYQSGSSNIAYPSQGVSYPNVRLLWDYQDAQNCANGVAGYPLTPNSPAASGAPLATCSSGSMTPGVGVVQPGWLTAPASTPEYLYASGATLLGVQNNLTVTHRVNSGGAFVNGVSQATASFTHATSLYVTAAPGTNQGGNNGASPAANYAACTPGAPITDPCQKYLYFQTPNTLGTYSYASSITIYYSGTSTGSSIKKKTVIVSSDKPFRDPLFRVRSHPSGRLLRRADYSDNADNPALVSGQIGIASGNSTVVNNDNSTRYNYYYDGLSNAAGSLTTAGAFFVLFIVFIIIILVVIFMICFKRWRRRRQLREQGRMLP